MSKKNRTELKAYFKENDKPTEKQFAEFIDAGINQAEDSIIKEEGSPLSIQAEGEDVGTQEILDLYTNFAKKEPNWSINLNPRIKSEDPNSNQSGLNIKDATAQSRLFIKSGKGSVGIGTIQPQSKLTIKGNNDLSLLSVIDTDNNKVLEIKEKEGVSIKGTLNIEGDFTSKNIKAVATNKDLDNEAASDEKVPTQKAVKSYIDNRLPKGLISMWSGKNIPIGWALCDGTNNTPNLSGKFIVGLDKNNEDYNETKKTGGEEQVQLTTEQLPSHSHSGTTKESGNHTHNFIGAKKKGDGGGTGSSNDYYAALTRTTFHSGIHDHSFITDEIGGSKAHENRPPYYVLAYIMKL